MPKNKEIIEGFEVTYRKEESKGFDETRYSVLVDGRSIGTVRSIKVARGNYRNSRIRKEGYNTEWRIEGQMGAFGYTRKHVARALVKEAISNGTLDTHPKMF